jgi:hypothetical protein
VRHATDATLDSIEPLLVSIRRLDGLTERKRGIWYRRSQGFLHFHEDPAGIFADLKQGRTYHRYRVSTRREREALLRRVRGLLAR